MKFGEKLRSQAVPEWQQMYLDYDKLKGMIKELEEKHLYYPQMTEKGKPNELIRNINVILNRDFFITKGTSLSIPRPTNESGMPVERSDNDVSQELFFRVLEQEMRKIEEFTKKQVFHMNAAFKTACVDLLSSGTRNQARSVRSADTATDLWLEITQ